MKKRRPGLWQTMTKNFNDNMDNLFELEEGDGLHDEEVRPW